MSEEERGNGEIWIYLESFYKTEQNIANKIISLNNAKNMKHIKNIELFRTIIINHRDIKWACVQLKEDYLSLKEEFKNDVINYFIESYKNGETPNPCVMCNKKLKFG